MAAVVVEQPAPLLRARSEIRAQMRRLIVRVVVLDALTITAAILAAVQLKFGVADWPPADIDWFTGIAVVDFGWLLPVWVASLAFSDAYSRRQFARGSDEFKALLKGSASAAAVVAMAAYLVNYDMSRGFFALTFGLGTGGLVLERYAVRRHVARLRSRDALMHRVVAVGDRFAVEELHQALRRQPTLGYQLVGACSTTDAVLSEGDVPLLGGVADAVDVCREVGADTLLIAGGSFSSSVDLRRIGWELEGDDIDLIVVPSLIDVAGPASTCARWRASLSCTWSRRKWPVR